MLRLAPLALLAPALLAGCSDQKLSTSNSEPAAAILSHEDGGAITEGYVVFTGAVSDPDNTADELTVRWYVGGEEACADPAEGDGSTRCDAFLNPGEVEVRLEVRDLDGAADSDVITLTVSSGGGDTGEPADTDEPVDTAPPGNTAPDCAITAPEDGGASSHGDSLTLRGTASDAESAPDQLTARWSSDRDGELGAGAPDSGGDLVLITDGLAPGTHVLTLEVSDPEGLGCSDFIVWDVLGTLSEPEIAISPAAPTTEDSLVVSVVTPSVDSDGDAVSYSIRWLTDGADAGLSVDTVAASRTSSGEVWTAEVYAYDGDGNASPTAAASVTIGNTAPTVSGVSIEPATAYTDDALAAVYTAADVDGDALSATLRWYVNGAVVASSETLDGALWFDRDDTISVEVQLDDGEDLSAVATSATLTVQNSAPTAPGISLSPALPLAGEDDLAVSIDAPSDDADGDAVSYRYAWTVDGAAAAYTGATVPAAATTDGETWRVEVTPDDGTDDGPSASAEVTIGGGNSPPVLGAVTLSPSPVYTDDTLSAAASATDADGDSVTLSYTWYVDGAAVGVTGSTLDGLLYFDRDQEVYVEVTADDGEDTDTATSAVLTVSNSPPDPPTAWLDPASPVEGDALVCYVDPESDDADGDAVSYTFEWTVNGVSFTDADTTDRDGDTVDGSETVEGDEWSCLVTTDDGTDIGGDSEVTVVIGAAASGDYKVVFVSSEEFNGNFGGVLGADDECQRLAADAGFDGTFMAWLSDPSSSPADRFTRSDVPYALVDGTQIAADWSDLTDGAIDSPIELDEYGDPAVNSLAFSFTMTDGTDGLFGSSSSSCYGLDCHCDYWTSADSSGPSYQGSAVAKTYDTSDDWTDYSFYNGCGYAHPIYCFEQ